MDDTTGLLAPPSPTAARPLAGLTVLAVEDSRFAAEALRLLSLKSGARIRRADSLETAQRHLRVYRPAVLIVDLGLPDGDGADLIAEMAACPHRVPVLLGSSGDPDAAPRALSAGADGFLAKPVTSLGAFQTAILAHLPADRQPPGPRSLPTDPVRPDPVALRDDMSRILHHLPRGPADTDGTDQDGTDMNGADENGADKNGADKNGVDPVDLDYVTQFLGGLARSASDAPLGAAVEALARCRSRGAAFGPQLAQLSRLVQDRLRSDGPL